jgi:hypothetical protein
MMSVKLHLEGVEALVKSKGGMQALVSNPFVLRRIYW